MGGFFKILWLLCRAAVLAFVWLFRLGARMQYREIGRYIRIGWAATLLALRWRKRA